MLSVIKLTTFAIILPEVMFLKIIQLDLQIFFWLWFKICIDFCYVNKFIYNYIIY